MKAVTALLCASGRLNPVLVLLAALAVALLSATTLLAAPETAPGQDVATPMATAAGHAGMAASPTHTAEAGHAEKPRAADDNHPPAAPAAGAAHTDEPAHESAADHADEPAHESPADHADEPTRESSAAHGHEEEAASASTSNRGLVLGGFGAVNGLVIVGAAIAKTRSSRKVKTRRISPSDTTPKGVAQ
jgi:hypothetical protein